MNIIWCDIITLYEDYEYKIMAIYEDWSTAFGDFPRQDGFFFGGWPIPKVDCRKSVKSLWIHHGNPMNSPWNGHEGESTDSAAGQRAMVLAPRAKPHECSTQEGLHVHVYIYMCIYVYVYVYKYRYRIYIYIVYSIHVE